MRMWQNLQSGLWLASIFMQEIHQAVIRIGNYLDALFF